MLVLVDVCGQYLVLTGDFMLCFGGVNSVVHVRLLLDVWLRVCVGICVLFGGLLTICCFYLFICCCCLWICCCLCVLRWVVGLLVNLVWCCL